VVDRNGYGNLGLPFRAELAVFDEDFRPGVDLLGQFEHGFAEEALERDVEGFAGGERFGDGADFRLTHVLFQIEGSGDVGNRHRFVVLHRNHREAVLVIPGIENGEHRILFFGRDGDAGLFAEKLRQVDGKAGTDVDRVHEGLGGVGEMAEAAMDRGGKHGRDRIIGRCADSRRDAGTGNILTVERIETRHEISAETDTVRETPDETGAETAVHHRNSRHIFESDGDIFTLDEQTEKGKGHEIGRDRTARPAFQQGIADRNIPGRHDPQAECRLGGQRRSRKKADEYH